MKRLIAWYGLPGSGKTTLAEKCSTGVRQCKAVKFYDDFMKETIQQREFFPYSKWFSDVVYSLRIDSICIVADVRMCEKWFRDDIVSILGALVPDFEVEWHCINCGTAKSIEICSNNVRFRACHEQRNVEAELNAIQEFAGKFSVEPECIIHDPVCAAH